MKAQIMYTGDTITKVKNCLCPDGKRRVAQTTADPDTWFSTPARVQVKGLKGPAACGRSRLSAGLGAED